MKGSARVAVLGLGDYGYALRAALTYYRYAVVAEGRCAVSVRPGPS